MFIPELTGSSLFCITGANVDYRSSVSVERPLAQHLRAI
jgi:hypothetical protein